MKNLKKELFDFNKNIGFEDNEIYHIVLEHSNALNLHSEKEVIASLNERLGAHKYHSGVRMFLESLNQDIVDFELDYELKTLYRILERKNEGGGMMFREAMRVVLEIINGSNDDEKLNKIINELSVHEWVPEVKMFIYNLTKSPEKRNNLTNGGNSEALYTIVEKVEGGHLAYIKDAWFFLGESKIEKVLLEDFVTNAENLTRVRNLETAMKFITIEASKVNVRIAENLTIGFSTDNKSDMFINEDKVESESTLESVFASPIVPIVNKQFYPLILEISNNLNKFMELDVVKKVYNLMNPYSEQYVINYGDNLFVYNCNARYGNSLYEYASVMELIQDVQNESNYDITFFVENKLSEEGKTKKYLEDKIQSIKISMDNIDQNLEKVITERLLLGGSETLDKAETLLNETKVEYQGELDTIKEILRTSTKDKK